jgi:hypothetical protein
MQLVQIVDEATRVGLNALAQIFDEASSVGLNVIVHYSLLAKVLDVLGVLHKDAQEKGVDR